MAAERCCFGWTNWEFAEGFGFLNASGSDIELELAEALLGTAQKMAVSPSHLWRDWTLGYRRG
jgi:hypothetical protein